MMALSQTAEKVVIKPKSVRNKIGNIIAKPVRFLHNRKFYDGNYFYYLNRFRGYFHGDHSGVWQRVDCDADFDRPFGAGFSRALNRYGDADQSDPDYFMVSTKY